jgi:predicted DNA-binding transcriptional regulator AlpA
MEITDHHLIGVADVAKAIGHSQRTLRRMIQDGEFPEGFPAPKTLKWMWGDVKSWIVRQKMIHELRPKRDITGQSGTSEKVAEKDSSEKKPNR